jgi:TRAP-type C4-dicarboxylate transport system permease small subunit
MELGGCLTVSTIGRVMDRVSALCYGLAAVALGAIVVLMALRILSRNLGWELAGLQLYAQALGVWMVFIVAGALGWERRHIEIDYFYSRLPDRVKPYHDVAVLLVNLLMCAFLVVGAVLAMRDFWTGTSPSVNIPLPLYYVPVLIGITMLAVVYVNRILGRVRTAFAGAE